MKRLLICVVLAWEALAAVRVKIAIGAGHPVRRPLPVVVVRRPVVLPARVVYAPVVVWAPRPVRALPARFEWEDAETLHRNEDWVESNLSVNTQGREVFLRTTGRVQINFAEVIFRNGQVQVIDFDQRVLTPGTYPLLDFQDGRHVETVRLVARARSAQARVVALMLK